ncbi:hypothetical protein [Methanococcus maripaludis]|uniref:Uncharacterized protein n=1 Tax=Methanococcus maripaludis (strain DSM 14266 / JCM 13030 / NBRC 101832 / S2 / LL) TaxID=267377 RepID=Q6LZ79_METMP|nr:hypothetical protein [Methanococcus maripaludis]CAF30306.1 hypothetical protein MMP0750 [Methanococcus maripaludis S2]
MCEDLNQKQLEEFKTVNEILENAKKEVFKKTGCEVQGIGILWGNEEYQVSMNSGVYKKLSVFESLMDEDE